MEKMKDCMRGERKNEKQAEMKKDGNIEQEVQ